MDNALNPLIPTAYDVAWTAAVVVALALLVIALVSIGRNRQTLTSLQALVWTLLVILLPFVGPLAWLVAGRPGRAAIDRAAQHAS